MRKRFLREVVIERFLDEKNLKRLRRDRGRLFPGLLIVAGLLLASCAVAPNWTTPSALAPAGPKAARIATLWWIFLGLGAIIYFIVITYLFMALFRRRRTNLEDELTHPNRGLSVVVVGGIVVPVVVLLFLFGANITTMAANEASGANPAVVIDVIGHQWWWEVHYPDLGVVTANEIHIPVDQPVEIRLTSADVIHSFWVPELSGKLDVNPGSLNHFTIEASKTGRYRGECAEFCGADHAKMNFYVVADSPDQFANWVQVQQLPANPAADGLALQGQQVFLGSGCVYCHTVQGTNASGKIGPDLTHLMSRETIAAGTLRNTLGNLGGWITNPQQVKPDNLMPATNLTGPELQELLYYLSTLR